ncbi:matrixin family metalloprotease [Paludibaculum fermentans]|uniref:Matrixin family metalloprotease n=1 Tax=Paludibaculum fermentans TaxID=1473598 RepID=A0A7S7SPN3_PALFE|nr:matrixin family metalloprotease [Paludibaculum fermentans]QOY91776.1 matrixin family metalloprotease [Paludibaculum fermentans]
MKRERTILAILLLAGGCPLATKAQDGGEPVLRLKSHAAFSGVETEAGTVRRMEPGRRHQVVQFMEEPTGGMLAALRAGGFRVLGYIPDHALLVSGPDGFDFRDWPVRQVGALRGTDKVSEWLGSTRVESAVVEFHPDVTDGVARVIVFGSELELIENPDLAAHQLMVRGLASELRALAEWDEVARVFPASGELQRGERVVACEHGGLGPEGLQVAVNLVATYGDGWDGPGLGAASLYYYFGRMPEGLPAADVQRELLNALGQWSSVVQLHFTQSFTAKLRRQVEFEWLSGSHGDGYSFDGPGGLLAHSFYPPPNAEPIAGDLHFDAAEAWKIGADIDIYSIALHELGHVLGLGHNDDPNSVMYPYYRRVNGLRPADVAEIRKLYAAATQTAEPVAPPAQPVVPQVPVSPATPDPAPKPAPATPVGDRTAPSVTITAPSSPVSVTTASSVSVRGIASDNVGVVKVSWSSSAGTGGDAVGTASFAAGPIALYKGINTITVRVWDAAGNQGWRSVTVTRK